MLVGKGLIAAGGAIVTWMAASSISEQADEMSDAEVTTDACSTCNNNGDDDGNGKKDKAKSDKAEAAKKAKERGSELVKKHKQDGVGTNAGRSHCARSGESRP